LLQCPLNLVITIVLVTEPAWRASVIAIQDTPTPTAHSVHALRTALVMECVSMALAVANQSGLARTAPFALAQAIVMIMVSARMVFACARLVTAVLSVRLACAPMIVQATVCAMPT
jgi:hypothetical protein